MSAPDSPSQSAAARIIAPVATELRRAGRLSVLAGFLWPVQAAAVAWAIDDWVSEVPRFETTLVAAVIFMLGGLARAALEHQAGRFAYQAADATIARERAALLRREARARADTGAAAMAALIAEKLLLLHPWITRYHIAMIRVKWVPLVLLALSFAVSWAVGLLLLIAGPLIPVFMALIGMAAQKASRRQLGEIASMNDMLMERLGALQDIRLLGAVAPVTTAFAARADGLRARTMAVLRIAFLSSTMLELLAALGVALIAVYVGFSLLGEIRFGAWATPLSVGEGVFLLLIAPEFFQPLRDMAVGWHDRASGLAVIEELEALDAAPRAALIGTGKAAAPLPGPLALRVEGAVAALPGATIKLPDVTLKAAQTLALTGPSGVGKSTMLGAIAGLVPLASGRIEVCGVPLEAQTADGWRARLAFVPQRVHFPDTSLGAWLDPAGVGGPGFDPARALELVDARALVERLPEGLDTRLGESGGGVSGGEARRLMLARAVLSGAELILADEPTADLDPDTAGRIIAALGRLQAQGRALIVATHDPVLARAMQQQKELAP